MSSNMATSSVLESLSNISDAMEDARNNVLTSYIEFDKKISTMEKNHLTVGSTDPIIESFIENRSTLVPEYIEETAKGAGKLYFSLSAGCITGAVVGSVLAHNVVLGALVFSGSLPAFIVGFTSAYLGSIAGGLLGIKIGDLLRRKEIRSEILKDIKDLTAALLVIKPNENGSFTLDKRTRKAMRVLSESIGTFKRIGAKANPPATYAETEIYSDVLTAIFAFTQKTNSSTAEKLLSTMNDAAEICMKQAGVDTSKVKSETRSAIKKAMAEEKTSSSDDNNKKDGE